MRGRQLRHLRGKIEGGTHLHDRERVSISLNSALLPGPNHRPFPEHGGCRLPTLHLQVSPARTCPQSLGAAGSTVSGPRHNFPKSCYWNHFPKGWNGTPLGRRKWCHNSLMRLLCTLKPEDKERQAGGQAPRRPPSLQQPSREIGQDRPHRQLPGHCSMMLVTQLSSSLSIPSEPN